MDTPTLTHSPAGPMGQVEFNARVATLSAKYGPNVALKMARRERKARNPLHKAAQASRRNLADVATQATGEFHAM